MRTHLAPVALAALCLSGCGDPDPIGPPLTELWIKVTTTGVDEDPDGYLTRVGDGVPTTIPAYGVQRYVLEPGIYSVSIEGLAPNCTVEGPASTSVSLVAGYPTQVAFAVECRAVTGAIEVRTASSGRDFPASYSLSLTDGSGASRPLAVAAEKATAVTDLAPGQYELHLSPAAANCTVTGEDTRTVAVTAGGLTRDTARVEFAVACQATTGDVRLSLATTGSPANFVGFTVKIDGIQAQEPTPEFGYDEPVYVPPNGSHLFERLAPGDHTIEMEVAGIFFGCAVNGPNPQTVSVALGAVSDLAFSIVCDAP